MLNDSSLLNCDHMGMIIRRECSDGGGEWLLGGSMDDNLYMNIRRQNVC